MNIAIILEISWCTGGDQSPCKGNIEGGNWPKSRGPKGGMGCSRFIPRQRWVGLTGCSGRH